MCVSGCAILAVTCGVERPCAGMQVMVGDVAASRKTFERFFSVVQQYKLPPERYLFHTGQVVAAELPAACSSNISAAECCLCLELVLLFSTSGVSLPVTQLVDIDLDAAFACVTQMGVS